MQINKHVHALRIPYSVVTPGGVFMDRLVSLFMIYGTNGICLIDTGVASAAETIFDYIRSTDRRVEDISLIIQTDSFPDHIGSTRTIKAESLCKVAAHPIEKPLIENLQLQAAERPVPGFDQLVAGSVAVDRLLGDGEVFDLGCGLKLRVFHTPGHAKGSLSILLLGYQVLFSGDAIPVPGELPVYEDVEAVVSSIRKLRAVPEIRHLLSSYDEPRKEAEVYQRMDESLAYLQRIHEAVLSSAGTGDPEPMDLCRRTLGKLEIPPEAAHPLIARSCAAHLKLRDRITII